MVSDKDLRQEIFGNLVVKLCVGIPKERCLFLLEAFLIFLELRQVLGISYLVGDTVCREQSLQQRQGIRHNLRVLSAMLRWQKWLHHLQDASSREQHDNL